MALDRDELAARLAAANLSNNGDDVVDPAKWAAYVVRLTDALLAALVPVEPASGAPATEPRRTVGAVVRWHGDEFIVAESGDGVHAQKALKGGGFGPPCFDDEFVRWATREECERHGIPYVERGAAPSPAASPAPYVPKVGDVVGIDFGKEYGATRVVTKVDGDDVSYVRLNTIGAVICRHAMKSSLLTYLRPATAAERVAAGLDAPATAAPAFDEASEREAARVAVSRDAGDDFTRGWLARARVAAKGGAK